LAGKRVLFIVEDDVDDFELFYAYYRMLEEGYKPVIASHAKYTDILRLDPATGSVLRAERRIRGKRGAEFNVDITYAEALDMEWDALVVPGGRSPERARLYREAVMLVNRIAGDDKPVLAICHGPLLLASAGILEGRRVTGHPGIADDLKNAGALYTGGPAERDGCIVTARHTTTVHEGLRLFLEVLRRNPCREPPSR